MRVGGLRVIDIANPGVCAHECPTVAARDEGAQSLGDSLRCDANRTAQRRCGQRIGKIMRTGWTDVGDFGQRSAIRKDGVDQSSSTLNTAVVCWPYTLPLSAA